MESLSELKRARVLIIGFVLVSWCISLVHGDIDGGRRGGGQARLLLAFRETQGNSTFQCSPSGPCLPCQYSEKKDDKYHCSETGYRVPLKCIEVQDGSKEKPHNKVQRKLLFLQKKKEKFVSRWRKLLDNSSETESGKQNYVTYRSCVPVGNEEKVSVLGFEAIMVFLLLISSAAIYIRQKRIFTMPGVSMVRIPTNSPRF
ncbi:uncharacterized protein LOC120269449 [Dioscorea cayenensis subsp. rotundata]|uniref:Uncharacterized protein LOC120269449 n=1 Tax=Dioscorea cayennensis subsp. rotundata TaxID=55577 RepID=A0AB40BYY7_DIOCR|nr:uncharacterized protein LOC120269449 [Dioscorea cayenensis subsp. rotundata]